MLGKLKNIQLSNTALNVQVHGSVEDLAMGELEEENILRVPPTVHHSRQISRTYSI